MKKLRVQVIIRAGEPKVVKRRTGKEGQVALLISAPVIDETYLPLFLASEAIQGLKDEEQVAAFHDYLASVLRRKQILQGIKEGWL